MKEAENLTWSSLKLSKPRLHGSTQAISNHTYVYISISTAPLHKWRVTKYTQCVRLHELLEDNCWRMRLPVEMCFRVTFIILTQLGTFVLGSGACQKPSANLCWRKEKFIKVLLGSLLWTLHSSLLFNPGEDVLNNSIVSTSAPLYF